MTDALGTHAATLLDALAEVGDGTLLGVGRLLKQRVHQPNVYVTLVGETSSGKTTLLNGLLGSHVMPTGVAPTTGVVVQVLAEDIDPSRLLAINRDGTQEELERAEFEDLCREPDADLLRLQIRSRCRFGVRDGLTIFDTPGFNSVIAEHEEVLRSFVPQSDAVVFVTNYRNGFSQVDQDLFETIRQATDEDPDLPFLLVVNRVPASASGGDKRITEICANANDSMQRELAPILVLEEPSEDGRPLPPGEPVWQRVEHLAGSPERLDAVRGKLRGGLSNLAAEAPIRSSGGCSVPGWTTRAAELRQP